MTKKQKSKIEQYAEQSDAMMQAVKAKKNKSFMERVIILVWDITSHVYLPIPSLIGIGAGLILIFLNGLVFKSLMIRGIFIGIFAMFLFEVVWYSIKPPKE